MTLARVWRRQLCAASGAALIVPSAMLAALVALVLGGGFSGVGVLGQIFAGPPAPSPGAPAARGAAHTVATSIPVIPVAQFVIRRSGPRGTVVGGSRKATVQAPRPGVGSSGGAIGSGGLATRPVGGRPSHPGSGSPGPTSGSAAQPSPSPSPSPPPTLVDKVVQVVTSVTSQIPGPVGSTATQAVQSAGNAADGLLPGGGSAPSAPSPASPASAGLKLP